MRLPIRSLAAALPLSLLSAPAHAHHSAAAYDVTKQVTVEGVVDEFEWKNPHIYIILDVKGPDGGTVKQQFEAGSSSVLLPLGLTAHSIAAGEHVVISANPRRSGESGTLLGRTLTKDDGTVLPLYLT